MSTHIIRFKKDWRVEWEGTNERAFGKITLSFQEGDVVSCIIYPDGPGSEELDYPVCEVHIAGLIDFWNVPDDTFEVLVGQSPESMRHL